MLGTEVSAMRIRGGLPVLWRREGESQIGVEAGSAVVLTGLTTAEQHWLDLLERDRSEDELLTAARNHGIALERATAVLTTLESHGLLTRRLEDPALDRSGLLPEEEYWQRHHTTMGASMNPDDGPGLVARRANRVVAVMGLGRVGVTVACALAAGGVGTVLVADRRVVGRGDVGLGAFMPHDVGRPREERARALLRGHHEQVATSAPARTRPDLVIMCVQDVAEPPRLRPLMREDIPHLLVAQHELSVLVGPLVVPGLSPCVRCMELQRSDADPCWPALATQLLGRRERRLPVTLGLWAASLAAGQALAFLDHRETDVLGASLVIDAASTTPHRHRWQHHPHCGCHELPAQAESVGTSTSSPRTSASTAAP